MGCLLYFVNVRQREALCVFSTLTLRYGTLRIETYGSTLRYGFLRYVTLREGGKHALVVVHTLLSVSLLALEQALHTSSTGPCMVY